MTMNMQRTIGNSISLRRTVTDLGRVDSSLSGILSPGYAPDEMIVTFTPCSSRITRICVRSR